MCRLRRRAEVRIAEAGQSSKGLMARVSGGHPVNEAAEAYRGVGEFDLRDESRSYGGMLTDTPT